MKLVKTLGNKNELNGTVVYQMMVQLAFIYARLSQEREEITKFQKNDCSSISVVWKSCDDGKDIRIGYEEKMSYADKESFC